MEIAGLQALLRQSNIPAWLFYDFRRTNPIAYRVLGLGEEAFATRRWYYLLPAAGRPRKLVSAIEAGMLDPLPGEKAIYRTWQEREGWLEETLSGLGTVAMEYSPRNAIPYASTVDAGTVELVRSCGVEVVSSADLLQEAVARWGPVQWRQHTEASARLMRVKDEAFAEVRRYVQNDEPLTDYGLQQFMLRRFAESGLVCDHPPIVATNANCSNPHYGPTADNQTPIRRGDVLMIDFWATLSEPGAVYADHTWMGYVGAVVPEQPAGVFAVVAQARDSAIAFLREAHRLGRPIYGWQVDDAARQVVQAAGYGDYFVHRTGHSIGTEVHGPGTNMDNYETHDERQVLPSTCFSIEPGIYLPTFGVRSEVDVFYGPDEVVVTGVPIQTAMVPLLR